MDILWAPWRMEYILNMKKTECIFCEGFKKRNDKKNLVLYRGAHSIIMLNKYPYAYAHLMIAPLRHLANFEDLNKNEKKEIFDLIQKCVRFLKKLIKPQGFNIGINIGRAAGAGILGHVHLHIVPRWEGDTNFMPVLGKTKVISEEIKKTYKKLKKHIYEL